MNTNPLSEAPKWYPALAVLHPDSAWSPWTTGYMVVYAAGHKTGWLNFWNGKGKPMAVAPVNILSVTQNNKGTWALASKANLSLTPGGSPTKPKRKRRVRSQSVFSRIASVLRQL